VDLQSYAAWKQESTEKIAAAGGGGSRVSMSLNRRPMLDLPLAAAVNDSDGGSAVPGAEFEPVSPLDVPAFLRRQTD
jgi:hypothetical protein